MASSPSSAVASCEAGVGEVHLEQFESIGLVVDDENFLLHNSMDKFNAGLARLGCINGKGFPWIVFGLGAVPDVAAFVNVNDLLGDIRRVIGDPLRALEMTIRFSARVMAAGCSIM